MKKRSKVIHDESERKRWMWKEIMKKEGRLKRKKKDKGTKNEKEEERKRKREKKLSNASTECQQNVPII